MTIMRNWSSYGERVTELRGDTKFGVRDSEWRFYISTTAERWLAFPVRCVRDYSAEVSISEQCCRNFKTSLSCLGDPLGPSRLWAPFPHSCRECRSLGSAYTYVVCLPVLWFCQVAADLRRIWRLCIFRPMRQGFNRQT